MQIGQIPGRAVGKLNLFYAVRRVILVVIALTPVVNRHLVGRAIHIHHQIEAVPFKRDVVCQDARPETQGVEVGLRIVVVHNLVVATPLVEEVYVIALVPGQDVVPGASVKDVDVVGALEVVIPRSPHHRHVL